MSEKEIKNETSEDMQVIEDLDPASREEEYKKDVEDSKVVKEKKQKTKAEIKAEKKEEKRLKKEQEAQLKLEEKERKKKKPKKRFGDRRDGRRIRTLPPMDYVVPFIMKDRNDASNLFKSRVDMDIIENYLKEKKADYRSLGFMHIIAAAYVRVVSQKPAINRFIAGQRIFKRDDIRLSMVVKKSMELNAQESVIKVIFEPTDTLFDVHAKMEKKIAEARAEGDTNAFDRAARALFVLPALLFRGLIYVFRFMDYFGFLPKALDTASPFHASFFISNLGSLGIPPIFHHLYNFGNLPIFITFGAMYRERTVAKDGTEKVKRYIDYTVVSDERITDGHYFASAFKTLEHFLRHPNELELPPENVVEDVD